MVRALPPPVAWVSMARAGFQRPVRAAWSSAWLEKRRYVLLVLRTEGSTRKDAVSSIRLTGVGPDLQRVRAVVALKKVTGFSLTEATEAHELVTAGKAQTVLCLNVKLEKALRLLAESGWSVVPDREFVRVSALVPLDEEETVRAAIAASGGMLS